MNHPSEKSGLEAVLDRPISALFSGKESFLGYVIDEKLEAVQFSSTTRLLIGSNPTRLSDYHAIVSSDDLKKLQRLQRNSYINREDYECTYRIEKGDGEIVCLEERGKVLLDAGGRFCGLFCQLSNTSEQKALAEDLKSAMEMARFPMENPNPVFRVRDCGQLLFANSPAVRLLEKLGLTDGKLKDSVFLNHLTTAIEQKKPVRYNLPMDEELTYSIFIAPAIAENYANIYTSDISEIAELQKRILQNLADLQSAINSTEDIMVLMDDKMNVLAFNQKAEALALTLFRKKLTTQSQASDYFDGNLLFAFERQFGKCMGKSQRYEFEYDFQPASGERLWFRVVFNPVKEESSGKTIGVCMNIKDITESRDDLQQLEAQKAFYETILDNIPADIAIFDDQHRYLYVNPQGIKDKNLRTWMIGKSDYDYCKFRGIGTAIADERRALFQNVLKAKKELAMETEHTTLDGSIKSMLRKFYPYYQNGTFKLMIGYGVDISEVKQVQRSFMQSEHRYRTLFENNPLMVFIVDKAGTILSLNAAVTAELGYLEKQMTNKALLNFLPEINRQDISLKIASCFETPDKEFVWENRMTKKSGKSIDTEVRAKVIYSETGVPQLLLVCNNISNRKQNERLLEESEKLNRRLIQELPVPVAIIQDNITVLTNEAFDSMVGKAENGSEFRFNEIVLAEDRSRLNSAHEQLLRGSESVDYTLRISSANGNIKHVSVRDSFFNYKNNLVTLTVMNDVTDRVLIENKNKEIEERTKQILDSALDAIVLTDLLGNIIDWNQQAQNTFHWESGKVIGKKLEDIILPEIIREPGEESVAKRRLSLNRLIETGAVSSDGRQFPIELFIAQIVSGDRKMLAFYIRDISSRKAAERKIQETERIDSILTNYSASVYQIDNIPGIIDHLIATFNSICNLCEISVYLADLNGQSLIRFHIGSTVLPTGTDGYLDENIPFGSGLIGHAAATANMNIVQDVSEDTTYGLEQTGPGAQLAAPILVNNKVFAVLHYRTHIVGFFSEMNQQIIRKLFETTSSRIAKIIDEQNQFKMTKELIRNNAQLQQYSYIVSHNLRAPIANLLGLSRIFNQADPSDTRNSMIIKNIESSASNIDTILRDLNEILSIKKDSAKSKEFVRFEEVLSTVLKGLQREVETGRPEIRTDFRSEGMFTIKSYMTSIFSNLVANSIKYRSDERPCIISISSRETPNSVVLEFQDNGIGIDLERFGDKVFGLYKRFHMHVEGSGIGLHLVKSQVEAINGHILLSSRVNEGTRFTIEINHE